MINILGSKKLPEYIAKDLKDLNNNDTEKNCLNISQNLHKAPKLVQTFSKLNPLLSFQWITACQRSCTAQVEIRNKNEPKSQSLSEKI